MRHRIGTSCNPKGEQTYASSDETARAIEGCPPSSCWAIHMSPSLRFKQLQRHRLAGLKAPAIPTWWLCAYKVSPNGLKHQIKDHQQNETSQKATKHLEGNRGDSVPRPSLCCLLTHLNASMPNEKSEAPLTGSGAAMLASVSNCRSCLNCTAGQRLPPVTGSMLTCRMLHDPCLCSCPLPNALARQFGTLRSARSVPIFQ